MANRGKKRKASTERPVLQMTDRQTRSQTRARNAQNFIGQALLDALDEELAKLTANTQSPNKKVKTGTKEKSHTVTMNQQPVLPGNARSLDNNSQRRMARKGQTIALRMELASQGASIEEIEEKTGIIKESTKAVLRNHQASLGIVVNGETQTSVSLPSKVKSSKLYALRMKLASQGASIEEIEKVTGPIKKSTKLELRDYQASAGIVVNAETQKPAPEASTRTLPSAQNSATNRTAKKEKLNARLKVLLDSMKNKAPSAGSAPQKNDSVSSKTIDLPKIGRTLSATVVASNVPVPMPSTESNAAKLQNGQQSIYSRGLLGTPFASSPPLAYRSFQEHGLASEGQYQGLGQGIWPISLTTLPLNAPTTSISEYQQAFVPYYPMFGSVRPYSNNLPFSMPMYNPGASEFTPSHLTRNYHTRNETDPSREPHLQQESSHNPLKSTGKASTIQTLEAFRKRQSETPKRKSPGTTFVSPLVYSKKPDPHPTYMINASLTTTRLSSPQPLLIINDLNGTLIYRPPGGRKSFKQRPGLGDFLNYLYNTHTVMIWTSAKPENCNPICMKLLSKTQYEKTVAMWARDKLGLTAKQYAGRTNVFKKLGDVWADEDIQKKHPGYENGGRWSQKNTLLIDDSTLKAAAQPFNLINISELTKETLAVEESAAAHEMKVAQNKSGELGENVPLIAPHAHLHHAVLRQVAGYLEEAKWWADVSAFVRGKPFKTGAGWGVKGRAEVPHAGGEATLTLKPEEARLLTLAGLE